jgi:hypothetical protein
MRYVTYDEAGNLTGSYLQDVHPDHLSHYIPVSDEIGLNWTAYKANVVRNGVEPAPPVVPPVVVPDEVTRRRGLQALLISGVTEAMIEAAIEAALTGLECELALIEFRTSQTFERNRPLVLAIGGAMGLDLDELFTLAASLP